jgi:hypothetical protein
MNRRILSIRTGLTLLAALVFIPGGAASAASVTWQTPIAISTVGDSIIDTSGLLVEALTFGGTTDRSVNGVLFQGQNQGGVSGSSDFSGLTNSYARPDVYQDGGVGADFEGLLDSFAWRGGTPRTISFTGLTIGAAYRVQFLVSDDRPCCAAEDSWFASGGAESDHVPLASSYSVIATFTANASTQTMTVDGDFSAVLNGYQIRVSTSLIIQGFAPTLETTLVDPEGGSGYRFGNFPQDDSVSPVVNSFDPALGQLMRVRLLFESTQFTTSAYVAWEDNTCDGTVFLGVCSSSNVGGTITLQSLGFSVSVNSSVLGGSPLVPNRTDHCTDDLVVGTGVPQCGTILPVDTIDVASFEIILTGTDVNDFIAAGPGDTILPVLAQTGAFDWASDRPFSDLGEAASGRFRCPADQDPLGSFCSSFIVDTNFFVMYDYAALPEPSGDLGLMIGSVCLGAMARRRRA